MTKLILVVGTYQAAQSVSAILGLHQVLTSQGVDTAFYKPVQQPHDALNHGERLLHDYCDGVNSEDLYISAAQLQQAIDNQQLDELMEMVIANVERVKGEAAVVLLQGLVENEGAPYAQDVNQRIARALGADVILLSSAEVPSVEQWHSQLDYAVNRFGGYEADNVLGAIIHDVGANAAVQAEEIAKSNRFDDRFQLLGVVPANVALSAPRVADLQAYCQADVLFEGEMATRRVHGYVMPMTQSPDLFSANDCVFLSADGGDEQLAATIAAMNHKQCACLVLTGQINKTQVMAACRPLLNDAQLPILHIANDGWQIAQLLTGFNRYIPEDDEERAQKTKEYFAEHIKSDWVVAYLQRESSKRLSPAAFRYSIVQRAIEAQKIVVLPEGDEPRTVVAASICGARGMAKCVLLGEPEAVQAVAEEQGVTLGENVEVLSPTTLRERYWQRLVELRAHKGMTEALARTQLEDNVVLGTMMLEAGDVDGLVSGAVHTTANTIRPPLQLIKTAPGAKTVSSVFFMCLPEQVLVYGDCAIIPNPSEDELAQVAIQSHDSAKAFGIEPRVAMISYSTGTSGAGADVEKVKMATDRVRTLRPDILVDGPLQYDAAAVESVGKKKAPDSEVAGRATVFIFPDLNTGNTTYKAVQRSANAISMGPVLQGMRKPVNDLSRGALVDDIVYTIAITAVQATQQED